MPDVDAIIDGLRRRGLPVWAPSARLGVGAEPSLDGEMVVPLADAEAAVLAAVDARTAEIVKVLRDEEVDGACGDSYVNGWISALHLIERRFPNGGTNDGQR